MRLTPCPECTTRGFSDRSRRRSRSRAARGGARMRGQAPSNSPLSRLFVTRHTGFCMSHRVRVRGSAPPCAGVAESPSQAASPNQLSPRHGQGKGRWSRASIDPYPSLVFGFGRRVNSAIRERGFRDPHSRNSPPPWSRIAALTRLLSHNRFAAVVATLFMVELCGLLDSVAPPLDEVSDCPRALEV